MDALQRDYVVKFRDNGLLCLNVQARGGHVVAYSFARRPDGTPGPAERCGAINLGDQIVGVNDTDLTKLAFRDKVAHLRAALTDPQSSGVTLYFRRATQERMDTADKEGARTRAAARRLKRANRAARVYTNVPEVEYVYVDSSAAARLRAAVMRAVNHGITQVRGCRIVTSPWAMHMSTPCLRWILHFYPLAPCHCVLRPRQRRVF